MFENLREDWHTHERMLSRQGLWVMAVYRFGRWRYTIRWRLLRMPFSLLYKVLKVISEILTGIELPCEVTLGRRFRIDHFGGIIISGDAVFGDDCIIRNGVTVGLKHTGHRGSPILGDRVDIGAGAKILGPIQIGNDVSIGANAVVLTDVPPNSVAVGVPARVLPRRTQSPVATPDVVTGEATEEGVVHARFEETARFEDNSSVQPELSVVVIGRNEGRRLARCFESIARVKNVIVNEVIYVDSASTDCSAELASGYGALSITVRAERPTAAVARNTGWRRAASDLILFLDGDTVLHSDFPRVAYDALSRDESIAAVWGHRREMHPERSIFNRVLDLDWIYRPGLTEFCGGDVLMRRAALAETGGFDDGLIAGEEPELCRRIRACGFKILHIDEPMTLHDLDIKHWTQYLKRSIRAGYAYAEISGRFRDSDEAFWSSEQRDNVIRGCFWAISFAAAGIASVRFGALPSVLWFTLLLVLSLRSAWRARWKSGDLFTLLLFGIHSQLQQVPICLGQLKYAFDRNRSSRSGLIEYKTN